VLLAPEHANYSFELRGKLKHWMGSSVQAFHISAHGNTESDFNGNTVSKFEFAGITFHQFHFIVNYVIVAPMDYFFNNDQISVPDEAQDNLFSFAYLDICNGAGGGVNPTSPANYGWANAFFPYFDFVSDTWASYDGEIGFNYVPSSVAADHYAFLEYRQRFWSALGSGSGILSAYQSGMQSFGSYMYNPSDTTPDLTAMRFTWSGNAQNVNALP
jgi:hypothetical protein